MEPFCLTNYVRGGATGRRIDPAALAEILATLPQPGDHSRLLATSASGNAAAYRTGDQHAVIVANEFFTPIVDEPRTFGRIAAASAIGAVYALGGAPAVAVAIVGFPVNRLPVNAMQDILRGGVEICMEAGMPLAGSHSIENDEPMFGLSVVGVAQPECFARRSGPQPGDVLITTKPLGLGILAAAMSMRVVAPAACEKAMRIMSTLNQPGTWLGQHAGVHALAAIGSAGLAGEVARMARAANGSISIDTAAVPVLEEAWALAAQGIVPGDAQRNLAACGEALRFECDLSAEHQLVFTDPQISGGLLMAVAPDSAEFVLAHLKKANCPAPASIGRVLPPTGAAGVVFA